MKKLIVLPLLFLTAIVYAQPGIKAGVNISNFTGGDFKNFDNNALVSFHGGGFWRFNFGKLALQPELLFSGQGAKLDSLGNEETYKVNYLNIPIMLQYHTDGGFYVEAGPQAGFKLSEDIPDNINIEDFAKEANFSFGAGLGWQGKGGLGIGARYLVGISDVGDFESPSFDSDFKQGVLQLSLFFTFFTKKP